MISMITRIFMSKTTCNKNVVIVRLDRTIQYFLDSPIESGNDDYIAPLTGLSVIYPRTHLWK